MAAKFLDLNNLSWQRRPFALSNEGRNVWDTVCSWVQPCTGEPYMSRFVCLFVCLFFSICAGQQFIEIIRSCATMLLWRNDFSSLEASCSYSLTWAEKAPRNDKQRKLPFQMLWALCFSFQVPLLLSSMVRLYHLNHVNDYIICYGHCSFYTSVIACSMADLHTKPRV